MNFNDEKLLEEYRIVTDTILKLLNNKDKEFCDKVMSAVKRKLRQSYIFLLKD